MNRVDKKRFKKLQRNSEVWWVYLYYPNLRREPRGIHKKHCWQILTVNAVYLALQCCIPKSNDSLTLTSNVCEPIGMDPDLDKANLQLVFSRFPNVININYKTIIWFHIICALFPCFYYCEILVTCNNGRILCASFLYSYFINYIICLCQYSTNIKINTKL